MAKKYGKKVYIGNINKTKDGKGSYLKISNDVNLKLKKGEYVNLESVADQIKGLEEAAEAGRLSDDYVADRIAELQKSKDEYGLLFTVTYTPVTES
jgi:anaerobic ribonucleoside-triphosphate reductase